jgi:hypothetical protein
MISMTIVSKHSVVLELHQLQILRIQMELYKRTHSFLDECYRVKTSTTRVDNSEEPVKIPVTSTQNLKSSKYEVHNRAV